MKHILKHVRIGEVDTPEEVARELNKIIDNVNQIEAKVELFDRTFARKSWASNLFAPKEQGKDNEINDEKGAQDA